MSDTFYITTPIYYVNDVPHIGHAYTTVAADVVARYRRLQGARVFFLTGLDEHGQKVQQAADKAGVAPKAFCDRLAPQFQSLWEKLCISNDAFIRTTDSQHQRVVQQFLQTLFDKQLIYKSDYTGWYCTFDERFWTGKDLADGLCPECKRQVERLTEANYFFKMSQFQDRLVQHIDQHPEFILPKSRRNEVLGFLQKPLEDLSISRPKSRLAWGIELPFDTDYVTYVWFDALTNYISALHYLTPTPSFEALWPADIHLVGKDILTTHSVYWSTILMALDLPLPRTIFAHGWWTVNGEKMSKSRGNVVDPYATVDEFGPDAFRYFLLREVPFGHDGDFSRDALAGRVNSDLANGLGNLLSRTVTLIERSNQGQVPRPDDTLDTDHEKELRETADRLLHRDIPHHLGGSQLEFNRALEAIWALVQLSNQYIDHSAPWVLAKKPEERPRLDTVLYHVAETLRFLAIAVAPFMPNAAREINRQLGLGLDFDKPIASSDVQWGGLQPGTHVAKGKALFPRVEARQRAQGGTGVTDIQGTEEPKTAGPARPAKAESSQITLEEFQKVNLRTGRIVSAERVPKSEKLLKLQVDVGGEPRQIVAGIGKKYDPESLVGRTIVVVANLKPAKLMGVESQGMVLAAGEMEVAGLVTLQEEIEPGTKVK